MVMTDPVADMATRIRNAAAARRGEVLVPFSSFKQDIAQLLKKEGYIEDVRKFKEQGNSRQMLSLKGLKVSSIKRLSKPGQRWYVSCHELQDPPLGIKILSTSSGVMTHKEGRRRKLGGELVLEIS